MGYEGDKAKIKMNFGPEEIATYVIADIFGAVDRYIISADEARHLLSTYHKWDITGKAPPMPKFQIGGPMQGGGKKLSPSGGKVSEPYTSASGELKQPKPPEAQESINPTIIETELPEGMGGYNKDLHMFTLIV
jgi:hypothetical protein